MTLSQRIVTIFAITGTVCASATLRRVIVLRIGRKFNPFQIIAVHKGTGVGLVRQPLPFGCELHAHRLHLLVEVRQILHALRVERSGNSPALDVDALALRHARVHHACDVAQHGLHVTVTYCEDFRQILCYGLRFHGLALHYGLGIVNALLLLKRFFPKGIVLRF